MSVRAGSMITQVHSMSVQKDPMSVHRGSKIIQKDAMITYSKKLPALESGQLFDCLNGLQSDSRAEEFKVDLFFCHAEAAEFLDHLFHERHRTAYVNVAGHIDHFF